MATLTCAACGASSQLLERVLAAAHDYENDRPVFRVPRFDGAIFEGTALFRRAAFRGDAIFHGATFKGSADFGQATFGGGAEFDAAIFEGDAQFQETTFEGHARFDEATFHDHAGFRGAPFHGDARFQRATFHSGAEFYEATFHDDAAFVGADFHGPAGFEGATLEGDAKFGEATFHDDARFSGATFHGNAKFERATFDGNAKFERATFHGEAGFKKTSFRSEAGFPYNANFKRATFQRRARFDGATFPDDAWFNDAVFQGEASFGVATFHGNAWFQAATFRDSAWFVQTNFWREAAFPKVSFHGDTWFEKTSFLGRAAFDRATFQGDAWFGDAEFGHDARFKGVSFDGTRQFGPLLAHRGLDLDDVQFALPVQIEVSTTGICCRRARFPAGVQFRLRWARVVLDDTDFPAPSIVTGIPRLTSKELADREREVAKAWQGLQAGEIPERPQLLSLQRANVTGLGLSDIDMANCRFAGAHNLDKLRLEADVSFATAPSRLGRLSQGGWREAIAEEHAWRASNHRWWWPKWAPPRWPDWLADKPQALNPGQIAGLYRALRKGREDIKNEPGAADFYYGEMEMRRRAARPVERVVLTAYWLVSGYGLRAWRALVWLAGITAALAIAFHLVGFVHPPKPDTYWTSWLYAFRATLSLTDPEVTLTAWGKLLQAVLRLTGPVLLGLAILALRGRVKR
jgi:uncharacterized protein YjbI with pentapeptide repeats